MHPLTFWFSRARRGGLSAGHSSSRPTRGRLRPALEHLEDRTLLSAFFVVPAGQANGQQNFATLQDAVNHAQGGDVITIRAGSSPGTATVPTNNPGTGAGMAGLTIQGDPAAAPLGLPATALDLRASGITLRNLNLRTIVSSGGHTASVLIENGATGEQLRGSLLGNLYEVAGAYGSNGSNTIDRNTFVGTTGQSTITLQDATSDTVSYNTIAGAGGGDFGGIAVLDSSGVQINNNTIRMTGNSSVASAVGVQDMGFPANSTLVRVTSNTIVAGPGVGIDINSFNDQTMQVAVEGNDFHGSAVGVHYDGNLGTAIASTLGGTAQTGGLTSLGGNNFRGTATAILLTTVSPGAVLEAQHNIFPTSPASGSVSAVTGQIDTTDALDPARAFVQNVYNKVLGHAANAGQMSGWANILVSAPTPALGQVAVAHFLVRGSEALSYQVNLLYQQFLHRAADSSGLAFFVGQLQAGGTLEEVESEILASPEFVARTGGSIGTYYELVLGRTASSSDIAFWETQQARVGLLGVVRGIVFSTENRANEIQSLYQTLLHRQAGQADIAFWTTRDYLSIQEGIVSSNEFFNVG